MPRHAATVAEPPRPAEFLTLPVAAKRAGLSPRTLRRRITEGTIRAWKPAHKLLVRWNDVERWVEANPAS